MTYKTPQPAAHIGNWNDLFRNDPDYLAPGASGPPAYVPAIEHAAIQQERDRLVLENHDMAHKLADLRAEKERLRVDSTAANQAWIDSLDERDRLRARSAELEAVIADCRDGGPCAKAILAKANETEGK